MATEIKAPNPWKEGQFTIFLAGVIDMGDAPDWRKDVVAALADYDVLFLNPLRDDWDSSWEQTVEDEQFRAQVIWEQVGMDKADFRTFVFLNDSDAPITLLELGEHIDEPGVVCCEPEYQRKGNVDITAISNKMPVFESVETMILHLKEVLDKRGVSKVAYTGTAGVNWANPTQKSIRLVDLSSDYEDFVVLIDQLVDEPDMNKAIPVKLMSTDAALAQIGSWGMAGEDGDDRGEPHIAELMESMRKGYSLPPAVVIGSGKMVDGRHRIHAAKRLGYANIPYISTRDCKSKPAKTAASVTNSPAFKGWFRNSLVKDSQGNPLVVYRGEHGESAEEFHTRAPGLSFGDKETANLYAESPNHRDDKVHAPRVYPCFLRIEKPILNTDDPFIDFTVVIAALGSETAIQYALKHARQIEATGNWEESYSDEWGSVKELLEQKPEALNDLYMLAFPLLADHDFVAAAKAKGFDGAIHDGYGENSGETEYMVFDRSQVKSAIGNNGNFDPNHHSITASPENLNAFLSGSAVQHVVYHGTTHDFDTFDISKTREENFYGRGFYFSDGQEDTVNNYAGVGPDLENNIERRAEQLVYEWEQDAQDEGEDFPSWGSTELAQIEEKAKAQATSELKGPHEGAVMPCYLRIRKPMLVAPKGGPHFEMRYNERTGQESGSAMRLYNVLRSLGHDSNMHELWGRVMEQISDFSWFSAYEFERAVRGDVHLLDDNVNAGQLLADLWQKLGYDGIIMDAVVHFPHMKGLDPGTKHYIVWKPNQIKSAIGNKGTYSTRSKKITAATAPVVPSIPGFQPWYRVDGVKPYSVAEDFEPAERPQADTAEFQKWFGGSKCVQPDGTPLTVYHATSAEGKMFTNKNKGFGEFGHWFDAEPGQVETYSQGQKEDHRSQVMALYLSVQNPKVYADLDTFKAAVHGSYGPTLVSRCRKLRADLKKKGFDGALVHNHRVDDFWVVFDTKQIKSATGNSGEFSTTDKSILASSTLTPGQLSGAISRYVASTDSSQFMEGECDTFAMALRDFLRAQGQDSKLVVFAYYDDEEENDMAHVVVSWAGELWDINGPDARNNFEIEHNGEDVHFFRKTVTEAELKALGSEWGGAVDERLRKKVSRGLTLAFKGSQHNASAKTCATCGHGWDDHQNPPDFGCIHEKDGCGCTGWQDK